MSVQYGVFTRSTHDALRAELGSPLEQVTPAIYVNSYIGNDSFVGSSADKPLRTIGQAVSQADDGTTIGLFGVFTEEVTTPLGLNDVTLVGMGNQPRQATTSGVPNGGGATWLSPTSGTAALLTIRGQGWRVQNIYLNNSATAAPCIDVLNAGDPPAAASGEHTQILGCVFTGADDGVKLSDGANFITIDGCRFFNFTGSGDTAILAVTGVGTNWGYRLVNNVFYNNVNHLVGPLVNAQITGNTVTVHGSTVTSTIGFDLTGGSGNTVMGNWIEDNVTGAVAAWTGGTNDGWCNFYSDDGVTSGVPS